MNPPRVTLRRAVAIGALALATGLLITGVWLGQAHAQATIRSAAKRRCPPEMVAVRDFCIDRYEEMMQDKASGRPLSPFYPPSPRLLRDVYQTWQELRFLTGNDAARRMPLPEISDFQKTESFEPVAVSKLGVIPQGYVSYYTADRACENAGKRLCSNDEWVTACRGEAQTKHPYGQVFSRGPCNVYRFLHPALILHGFASSGHLDPRLNLLMIEGDAPVLRLTGESQGCASRWGDDAVFDMVGNLDEWVEAPGPIFRGGFYARATTKGCDSEITNHSKLYFDYSTGARCCMTPPDQR